MSKNGKKILAYILMAGIAAVYIWQSIGYMREILERRSSVLYPHTEELYILIYIVYGIMVYGALLFIGFFLVKKVRLSGESKHLIGLGLLIPGAYFYTKCIFWLALVIFPVCSRTEDPENYGLADAYVEQNYQPYYQDFLPEEIPADAKETEYLYQYKCSGREEELHIQARWRLERMEYEQAKVQGQRGTGEEQLEHGTLDRIFYYDDSTGEVIYRIYVKEER